VYVHPAKETTAVDLLSLAHDGGGEGEGREI
jgi:hypothetical protein